MGLPFIHDSAVQVPPPFCDDAISICGFQDCCYRGEEGCKVTPVLNGLSPQIPCVSTVLNPLDRTSNMGGGGGLRNIQSTWIFDVGNHCTLSQKQNLFLSQ